MHLLLSSFLPEIGCFCIVTGNESFPCLLRATIITIVITRAAVRSKRANTTPMATPIGKSRL